MTNGEQGIFHSSIVIRQSSFAQGGEAVAAGVESVDYLARGVNRVAAVGTRVFMMPVVDDDDLSRRGVRENLRCHTISRAFPEPVPVPRHPAPPREPVLQTR